MIIFSAGWFGLEIFCHMVICTKFPENGYFIDKLKRLLCPFLKMQKNEVLF